MRVLCLAILLVACTGDGSGKVAVVPGKPAGRVVDVEGRVTAARSGEAPRVLAVGDVVAGDDEIKTEADASILIELDHNRATFSLAPGRAQRVAASKAWSLPAAVAGTTSGEHSAAAGRSIERGAVDTSTSAAAPAAPTIAAHEAPPANTATTEPSPPVVPPPGRKDEKDSGGTSEKSAKPRDPKKPATTTPPPPPPPPPPPDKLSITDDATRDLEASKPSEPPAPALVVTGAIAAAVDKAIDRAAILGCWKNAPRDATATFTIAVDAAGKVARVTHAGGGAKTAVACTTKLLKAMTLGARAATSTAVVTITP